MSVVSSEFAIDCGDFLVINTPCGVAIQSAARLFIFIPGRTSMDLNICFDKNDGKEGNTHTQSLDRHRRLAV
jgi:hypothetical protein